MTNWIKEIENNLKRKGTFFVIVCLNRKLVELNKKLDIIQGGLITLGTKIFMLEQTVSGMEDALDNKVEETIIRKIRSTEALHLVTLERTDVHLLNKHIERLERKISELENK